MWWKFLLFPYEKTHAKYHPFSWLKKGRKKFILISSPPSSYLYRWKFHFHPLNVWKTDPTGSTVIYFDMLENFEAYQQGNLNWVDKTHQWLRATDSNDQGKTAGLPGADASFLVLYKQPRSPVSDEESDEYTKRTRLDLKRLPWDESNQDMQGLPPTRFKVIHFTSKNQLSTQESFSKHQTCPNLVA